MSTEQRNVTLIAPSRFAFVKREVRLTFESRGGPGWVGEEIDAAGVSGTDELVDSARIGLRGREQRLDCLSHDLGPRSLTRPELHREDSLIHEHPQAVQDETTAGAGLLDQPGTR